MTFSSEPGTILGYRKNGFPIRLQAGGSIPSEPAVPGGGNNAGPPAISGNDASPLTINVAPQPGQYFTAEQLEAARQQEKDKLYDQQKQLKNQIDSFKTQLDTLAAEKTARDAATKKSEEDRKTAEKEAEEAKMTAQEFIKNKEAEWTKQQEDFRKEMAVKQAVIEQEQRLVQLTGYIQRRVAEEVAAGTIGQQLLEYITGSTEEEVETSITKAKEKTASIVADFTSQMSGAPASPVTPRMPGVSPTGFGPSGPLDNLTGQKTYDAAAIKAMSMEEFKAYRKTVGLDKAGQYTGLIS